MYDANKRGIVVSIHAPREGCDDLDYDVYDFQKQFQFTHPGRGATRAGTSPLSRSAAFQFTHPGRGATVTDDDGLEVLEAFQFTHPGRGATSSARRSTTSCRSFNSRTPGGVRLWRSRAVDALYRVSIHAPREGCDSRQR